MLVTFQGLQTSLVQFIFNGTAETKLANLAFLSCGQFVKNSVIKVHTSMGIIGMIHFWSNEKFHITFSS